MLNNLLTLLKCGEEKRDVFVSECSSTSEQFIQPIHKKNITTFARENLERKNKSIKVAEKEFHCSIDNECRKLYCVDGSLKFETIPEIILGSP